MADIVKNVTEENEKRSPSLPIWGKDYAWWTEAVRAKLQPSDPGAPDQKTLAKKLGLSDSEVSRAINRTKPVYDVVIAISDELKVPRPAILPESEDEAKHLIHQLKLFRSDRQLEQVKSSDKPEPPLPPPSAGRRRTTGKHHRK